MFSTQSLENRLVSFRPLRPAHFLLLFKWLQMPHVRVWWDSDVEWTPELVAEKYKDCAEGVWDGKPLRGFIMCMDG